MQLTMLAKDTSSGLTGCPSIYLAEDGNVVVQGQLVDADTHANLVNLLPGEQGVVIAADVVLRAAELLTARG